jgi:hypothetical protein
MLARSSARFLAVRHLLAFTALALFANGVARADSISWQNTDGNPGVKTGSNTAPGSFFLSNSEITSFNNSPLPSGTTEFLNFTTGNWNAGSGSLSTGGSWAAGGTVTITESGVGVIFQGQFSGTTAWSLSNENATGTGCTGGTCEYSLNGAISGTYYPNGQKAGGGEPILTGSTVQLAVDTKGFYTGGFGRSTITDKGGATNIQTPTTVTAEPGTLLLMGTGLLGAGYIARFKAKQQSRG